MKAFDAARCTSYRYLPDPICLPCLRRPGAAAKVAEYPIYAPEFTSVVTLFFVISGFTLTCVYNSGGPSPRAFDFMRKRMARMAPSEYMYQSHAALYPLHQTTSVLTCSLLCIVASRTSILLPVRDKHAARHCRQCADTPVGAVHHRAESWLEYPSLAG
jgi:hypothetical protein